MLLTAAPFLVFQLVFMKLSAFFFVGYLLVGFMLFHVLYIQVTTYFLKDVLKNYKSMANTIPSNTCFTKILRTNRKIGKRLKTIVFLGL